MAVKDPNKKKELITEIRYTGDYIPWFNDNAVYTKKLVETLQKLPLQEKLIELNKLIKDWNSKAKPAIIKDGEVLIPHFYLIHK